MKKTLLYTLLAALMLPLVACDHYLDIQPVGKVIPTTATEFRALLTEAYKTVPSDRGLASFRADELRLDATLTWDIASYRDIWTWNDATPDENTASFSWRQFYHVLFIANYVIESEHSITEGSTSDIRQMVGEAYMLRAYMHFILANLHAPAYTECDPATTKAVPLKLDSDVETTLPRSTLAEIYSSILGDLDSAETYLNVDSWPLGYNYRFNTLSVDALRSRVALYMGKWDDAVAASARVIAANPSLASVTSTTQPNLYSSPESIVALEEIMPNRYAKAIKVNKDFFSLYTSADTRRSAYFKQVTASNITLLKGGDNSFSCSFRTGEMYLNAAEAAWHADDFDSAVGYLLTLQKARFNASGYASKETAVRAMTHEQLLTEILTERARELAFEGHRWFDLRRTTRPRIERSFMGETYVLEQDDPRYTIPIPSEAIQANPSLAL